LIFTSVLEANNCKKISRSPLDKQHTFMVGLRNTDISTIYTAARAVSDPNSPSYGNFWTWSQIVSTTSNPTSLSFVLDFFTKYSIRIQEVSRDHLWITLLSPIRTLEEIFNTTFYQYQCSPNFSHDGFLIIEKSDSHYIPNLLQPHIHLIGGISNWPFFKEPLIQSFYLHTPPSNWPQGPFLNISAIKQLYSVDSTILNPNTTISVFEVNSPYEQYNPPDLASFQQLSGLPNQPVTQFEGDPVTLGCDSYSCAEPVLDVSMILGMAPNVNFTYWTTTVYPVPPAGDVVLQFLIDLSSLPVVPYIHSISWGPPESDLTPDIAQRMDEEFAKLTLRGLTFVTSSGDDGVNFRAARTDPSQCGLSPQYPAGSPWVTTVGGTFGPEYDIPERTCQTNVPNYSAVITSGGGFSSLYPQPPYQTAFVQQYLKTAPGLPPNNTYTATNRAYPDISLIANNIDTIVNQIFIPLGGTSASAPLFAGMLALILDSRLQNQLPPLGAVNDVLYALAVSEPDIFNDIQVGDNHCTAKQGTQYTCCPYGFQATPSWDPVTGLGSVNFQKLKAGLIKIAQEKFHKQR